MPTETPTETLQQMAKRVCSEQKLTPEMTRDLIATIYSESSFDPLVIHPNKNYKGVVTSIDYGLCQFNDSVIPGRYDYWIGPGMTFDSPHEVLNDPEKCVRVMAKTWKNGGANNWSGYKSGNYKKYLNLV